MMLLVGGQRSTPSFGSMRAGLALLAIFGSLSLTMINRHDWQQEQQQHDSSGVGTSPLPKIKNFRADTVSSLVPMKDSEDQASLEPIHDTISSAPTDSLVPSMIGKPESIGNWSNDLNVVHIIHTRFMQHQPDLIHLGQARMDLFQTFTLPSIQQQTNQQFLWLIWTDQDLHQDLRRQLLDAVDHLDNAVVLGAAPPVKHTNLRNAFGHSLSTLVSHGNVWKNPQSLLDYFKASQTHLLLETQLDADDSLTATFVDTIQAQAAETVGQHEQEFLHKTMEIVCPSKHLEWRYYVGKELGEREVDAEYKSSSPGYWIEFENHDFCINSGMTYIFHLRADMRQLHLNHQCNYDELPPCVDPVFAPANNIFHRLTGPSSSSGVRGSRSHDEHSSGSSSKSKSKGGSMSKSKGGSMSKSKSSSKSKHDDDIACDAAQRIIPEESPHIHFNDLILHSNEKKPDPHHRHKCPKTSTLRRAERSDGTGLEKTLFDPSWYPSSLLAEGAHVQILCYPQDCIGTVLAFDMEIGAISGNGEVKQIHLELVGWTSDDAWKMTKAYVKFEETGLEYCWDDDLSKEDHDLCGKNPQGGVFYGSFHTGLSNKGISHVDICVEPTQSTKTHQHICRRHMEHYGPANARNLLLNGGDDALSLSTTKSQASVILARTPTAAGFKHVIPKKSSNGDTKSVALATFDGNQNGAWDFVEKAFAVDRKDVTSFRSRLHGNMENVLVDALKGQCTHGHSCKESTKKALGMLLNTTYHLKDQKRGG